MKASLLVVALSLVVGCQGTPVLRQDRQDIATVEAPVKLIPLSGEVADADAEISGLTWRGDALVLLPQYPMRHAAEGEPGTIYEIERRDLRAFLDGQVSGPVSVRRVPFVAEGIATAVTDSFEGFEAIAMTGPASFVVSVEAKGPRGGVGTLFRGRVDARGAFVVDITSARTIPTQVELANLAYEALVVSGESVVAIHEANGAGVVERPSVQRFSTDLQPLGAAPIDNLDYRVTDASGLDSDGRFFVMNYQWGGDHRLRVATEPLMDRFGAGLTHRSSPVVERLVEFRISERGVELTGRPPILLELEAGDGRNWEGLARFDGGFLIATDKFPGTLLGYVSAR